MNTTFDEALERLRGTGGEVAGGVAPNHGPMAAEALVALGRDDIVVAWADRYRRQLDAMPPASSPVTSGGWAQALGATHRFGDWAAFFRAQLAEAPWPVVFEEWIGRLLPATPSAGAHGLIRTAHALRALAAAETALRLEELGVALAYWAAYYRRLPGTPRLAGVLDLGAALQRIPLFLSGQPRPGMPRDVYLRVMRAHGREFSEAVDGAAEPRSRALSARSPRPARVVSGERVPSTPGILHTVTVPAALRLLLPHLPAGCTRRRSPMSGRTSPPRLRHTATRGLPSATIGRHGGVSDHRTLHRERRSPRAQVRRGLHREYRLNPRPAYLAAAADWASRLHRARHWSAAERDAAGLEFR